jgi:hypothetical protein
MEAGLGVLMSESAGNERRARLSGWTERFGSGQMKPVFVDFVSKK